MRERITDSFEALADYIGHDAALRLTEEMGGNDILVPKRETGRTWGRLVAALGEADARRFCYFFAGERIYIPVNATGEVSSAKRLVRALHAEGMSAQEIAKRVNMRRRVTARWVRRVLAED